MTAYQIAPDVAWVDSRAAGRDSSEVFLAKLPDGPPLALQGSAWLVWSVVAEHPELDDIVAEVATRTASPPDAVAHDVEVFLEGLVARGLLHRAATPAPHASA